MPPLSGNEICIQHFVKVHPLWEPRYVLPCVSNLTEETSCVYVCLHFPSVHLYRQYVKIESRIFLLIAQRLSHSLMLRRPRSYSSSTYLPTHLSVYLSMALQPFLGPSFSVF
jgi:hypothetical protein